MGSSVYSTKQGNDCDQRVNEKSIKKKNYRNKLLPPKTSHDFHFRSRSLYILCLRNNLNEKKLNKNTQKYAGKYISYTATQQYRNVISSQVFSAILTSLYVPSKVLLRVKTQITMCNLADLISVQGSIKFDLKCFR